VWENVVVLRPSKAIYSHSTAFGKSINPTFHRQPANRRARQPFEHFCASFYFVFPVWKKTLEVYHVREG